MRGKINACIISIIRIQHATGRRDSQIVMLEPVNIPHGTKKLSQNGVSMLAAIPQ